MRSCMSSCSHLEYANSMEWYVFNIRKDSERRKKTELSEDGQKSCWLIYQQIAVAI